LAEAFMESLIQQQPELLTSAEMPADFFASDEKRGEFTGERLFRYQPETYRLIVSLLAERLGVLRVARIAGVSPHTVQAVRDREQVPIAIEKQTLSALAFRGARLAMEAVADDLADPAVRAEIPTRDLALIAAISTDKGLLLAGEATARVEVEVTPSEHLDFNAYIASLRTCSGAETGGQKEGSKA